jgi:hypothetical protein
VTRAGEALSLSDDGACLALQTSDLSVGDGRWGRPCYGVVWTHESPQRSWIGWLTRV